MNIDQALSQYSAEQSGSWPRIARALIAEHASLRDEAALVAAFMAARKAREVADPGAIGWDAAYDREMGAGELLSALWDWQRDQPAPATVEPTEAVRLAGMRARLERACDALAGVTGLGLPRVSVRVVVSAPEWLDALALVRECGGSACGSWAGVDLRGVNVVFLLDSAPALPEVRARIAAQPDPAIVGAALVSDESALVDAS